MGRNRSISESYLVDVFACGCQKWMLGPHGTGFFYLADSVRDRLITPFMTWLGSTGR